MYNYAADGCSKLDYLRKKKRLWVKMRVFPPSHNRLSTNAIQKAYARGTVLHALKSLFRHLKRALWHDRTCFLTVWKSLFRIAIYA